MIEYNAIAQELASKLINLLSLNHQSLLGAESVTGGLVSHFLTNVSGASKVFLGSYICYSEQMKVESVNVPWHILHRYGTISSETVKYMLDGLHKFEATFLYAIVGVAEKEVEEKTAGHIIIGVEYQKNQIINQYNIKGTRLEIKEQACIKVFELLLEFLNTRS